MPRKDPNPTSSSKSTPKPARQATSTQARKTSVSAAAADPLGAAMLAGLDKPLIDHRVYTIQPRRMQAFLDAFEQLALPVLARTLGHPLGFWVSLVGPQNQFVHLWGYDSLADYEARCARRDADPAMAAYFQATRDLIVAQETRLIRRVALGRRS
jgi:hypothetical protein